jgi:hypothetical protein
MSRYRFALVAAVLLVFIAVGGYLVFANRSSGGQPVTINATVTGGTTMKPPELSAHHNDSVTINISSDTDGEVHLHGYNIIFEAKAGHVVSHTFKAVNTGRFPIEWETTSTPLGDLTVNP